jgi:hypothetical protein
MRQFRRGVDLVAIWQKHLIEKALQHGEYFPPHREDEKRCCAAVIRA